HALRFPKTRRDADQPITTLQSCGQVVLPRTWAFMTSEVGEPLVESRNTHDRTYSRSTSCQVGDGQVTITTSQASGAGIGWPRVSMFWAQRGQMGTNMTWSCLVSMRSSRRALSRTRARAVRRQKKTEY